MPITARDLTAVRRTPDDDSEQVTQLLPAEPVLVLERLEDFLRVLAPWQPCSLDPRGYPGWVRSMCVEETDAAPLGPAPARRDLMGTARGFLETPYEWGGLTRDGIDCSGLVHVVSRHHGLRVPRDASDQADTLAALPLDEVGPGDLYFFARPGRPVHHVGLVSAAAAPGDVRRMLHAPDSGAVRHVVEEVLPAERLETLVGAARLPRPDVLPSA